MIAIDRSRRLYGLIAALAVPVWLSACASTTVTVQPASTEPLCDASRPALVLWTTRWRANQKDVAAREAAAEAGLRDFFGSSECFAQTQLRRVDALPASVPEPAASMANERAVGIEVQELGPVVRLLSSLALVEGGTEVVLRVQPYARAGHPSASEFTVHWRHGGPGVVKGVASLRQDMQAALRAGLRERR